MFYFYGDHLGSSSVVTDRAGKVVQTTDYYPYGGVRHEFTDESFENDFLYTGKELDEELGIYYYGARYYMADVGRWMSEDPAVQDIGLPDFKEKYGRSWQQVLVNPQELNSYSYVTNNPLKYTDPTGEILPVIVVGVWMVAEMGFSAYDAYNTVRTLSDQNATVVDKSLSAGGFVVGLLLPGGGYGTGAKGAVKYGDDVIDAFRGLSNGLGQDGLKMLGTARDNLLNGVENKSLYHFIDDFYREIKPGTKIIGDGGTIDALKHELITREKVGGVSHFKKVKEGESRLLNILKGNLSDSDRQKASSLLNRVRDVLGKKGGDSK